MLRETQYQTTGSYVRIMVYTWYLWSPRNRDAELSVVARGNANLVRSPKFRVPKELANHCKGKPGNSFRTQFRAVVIPGASAGASARTSWMPRVFPGEEAPPGENAAAAEIPKWSPYLCGRGASAGAAPQCSRSAEISCGLVIAERPLMPISRARSASCFLVQSS